MIIVTTISLTSCASIPSEAPQLSGELGNRISALEGAHLRLLDEFFVEKRRRVDDFVQQTWIPVFAQEFFSDSHIDSVWRAVVQSSNPNDRLKFIVLVGPELQRKINQKRVELIQPLDELQSSIKSRIESEYSQAKAVNNALTSLLLSSSKVNESRDRYLNMIGVTDQKMNKFIGDTDEAISELVEVSGDIGDRASDVTEFRDKIRSIIQQVNE
jgi:hypothetical protein